MACQNAGSNRMISKQSVTGPPIFRPTHYLMADLLFNASVKAPLQHSESFRCRLSPSNFTQTSHRINEIVLALGHVLIDSTAEETP